MENIYKILTPVYKLKFFYLIVLMIIASILEMFGLSLIIPVMLSLSNQNIFSEYPFLEQINIFLDSPTNDELILISVSIFGLVYIIKNLYMIIFYFIESNFLASLLEKVSQDLFFTYIQQPYNYYSEINTSALITRFRSDLPAFRSSILAFSTIFIELFTLTGITIFLAIYNFKVFLVVFFLVLSFSTLFFLFFQTKFKNLGIEKQTTETFRSKSLQESFSAIKEIKISKLESIFSNFYNIISTKIKFNIAKISFLRDYEIKKILPLLGVFIGAALKFLPSANRLINSINNIKYNNKSVVMIRNDLRLSKNLQYESINNLDRVELRDISFSYNNKKIFSNLNFTINSKEKIFIYGETGCGKSTLLDLILGLKRIDSGKLIINKTDFSNTDFSMNKILGYVPQNVFLFDQTIKNNITLFQKQINDINFNNCLKITRLEKFVNSLDLKGESLVGQNGIKISGGQKQRIGIAREIYKKPEFFVFDESTSSLDETTEKDFFEYFLNYAKKKTVIFVSHNQKLKKYFDKVYKIQNGNIYEEK